MDAAIELFSANQAGNRVAQLVDLSTFGISIHKPFHTCFMCAVSTQGWSEGLLIDDLCEHHYGWYGGDGRFYWRLPTLVYTNQTVLVLGPVTIRWNGVNREVRIGVVRIEGRPYLVRPSMGDVQDGELFDPATMQVAHPYGIKIGLNDLERLHATQQ